MYILFYGAEEGQALVFIANWQSHKSPYKDIRRSEKYLSVFLYAHARRGQIAAELYVFFFFFLPFALLSSRVRHDAARLPRHGVGRITFVCAVTHYLLRSRLLLLGPGEPGSDRGSH